MTALYILFLSGTWQAKMIDKMTQLEKIVMRKQLKHELSLGTCRRNFENIFRIFLCIMHNLSQNVDYAVLSANKNMKFPMQNLHMTFVVRNIKIYVKNNQCHLSLYIKR